MSFFDNLSNFTSAGGTLLKKRLGVADPAAIPATAPANADADTVVSGAKPVSRKDIANLFDPTTSENLVKRLNTVAANANQAAARAHAAAAQTNQVVQSLETQDVSIVDLINQCQTNPLNDFTNYTYHLKWSIANNMMSLSWSMTVVEPYSISLVDKMANAAATLGVNDFMKSPYFIELWFTGYTEDGQFASPKISYSVWRMLIMKMDSTTNEVGTTWKIEGAIDNDLAAANYYTFTSGPITIPQTKTFGDFLDKLGDAMTHQDVTIDSTKPRTSAKGDTVFTTKYVFKAPDDVRSWSIVAPKPQENSQRNADFDVENAMFTTKGMVINQGTDIGQIINSVAAKCPDANKWIIGQSTSSQAPAGTGLIQVFVIHTQIEIVGYDFFNNDYIRVLTYTLVPYTSTKADTDNAAINKLLSPAVQKTKLQQLSKNKKFNRVYNYLYTGLNTDVIKFDISVNNFWVVAVPPYNAQNTYDAQTQGPVASPNSVGFGPKVGAASPGSWTGSAKSANTSTRAQALVNPKNLDATTAHGPAETGNNNQPQAAATTLKQQHTASLFYYDSVRDTSNLQNVLNKFTPSQQTAITAVASRQQITDANKYAEQYELASNRANSLVKISAVPKKQAGFANVIHGSDNPKTQVTQDSTAVSPGVGLFSTVLGNLFSVGPEFMAIDLEIRGDPYWIGRGNVDLTADINNNKGRPTPQDTTATFVDGDVMFLLTFKIVSGPNEDTGLVDVNNSQIATFTGLYRTMSVKSQFSDGKFTQVLSAAKEVYSSPFDSNLAATSR